MRFFLWSLIFRKIREDAINNGISPFLMYLITSILTAVLGGVGFVVGFFLGGKYVAYICAIAFVALGYYISYVIANHSFVKYTPRKKDFMQAESYVSNNYFRPWTHVELKHAQITIVMGSGGCAPPAVWEFFLNGGKAGEVKDGSPITFPTGHTHNVLVARNDKGALSPYFEFSVKSGRHLELRFNDGRFESVKDIGRMSLNRPEQSSGARHAAR